MTLKLVKNGQTLSSDDCQFSELNKFCSENGLELTFEWIDGQYWLHSDLPKEKPIGIEIDRELRRHEEYFRKSGIKSELLARAIGIKGPERPRVLDLTAGMLGDSLLFLSFGCEVWAVERNPVIQFLVSSALQNATHTKLQNFHFLPEDARSVLEGPCHWDVIFFDPMYEDANPKASPRKEMRIFRNVVGKDPDALEVFHRARALKPRRLVVKRPLKSIHLGEKPSVEYIGKSTRYDVYFSL